MKRKFGALRDGLILCLSLVCAAALYLVWQLPVFPMGNGYTYYYGEHSSAEAQTTERFMLKPQGVKGESTVYDGSRTEELIASYRATVLFTETACGVVNYYCYSPCLSSGIELCGAFVNLHIAESATQTAVGSPVIFGGF